LAWTGQVRKVERKRRASSWSWHDDVIVLSARTRGRRSRKTRGSGAKGRDARDAKVADRSPWEEKGRSDDEDGLEARTDGAPA